MYCELIKQRLLFLGSSFRKIAVSITVQFCLFVAYSSSGLSAESEICSKTFHLNGNDPVSITRMDNRITYKWKDTKGVQKVDLKSTNIAFDKLERIKLEVDKSSFELVNIGLRQLFVDTTLHQEIAHAHRAGSASQDLILTYGGEKLAVEKELNRLRKISTEKVINVYRNRKSDYLSDWDLAFLDSSTTHGQNFDTFILLDGFEASLRDRSDQQLENSLLSTIQISYQGRRSSWQIGENARQLYTVFNELPFLERLPEEEKHGLHARLVKDFGGGLLGEITRYSSFQNLAPPIQAKLLLKLLKTAESRGLDVFVISTDKLTKRLFSSKYGFKLYTAIRTISFDNNLKTISSQEASEYLLYLEVKSEEYKKLIDSLTEISNQISQEYFTPF